VAREDHSSQSYRSEVEGSKAETLGEPRSYASERAAALPREEGDSSARVASPGSWRDRGAESEAALHGSSQVSGLDRGDRLEALYAVAITTGLRRGEVLGLRWEDVDLDEGTLAVRRALQRLSGGLQFTEPKTDRARRTLALPAVTVAALRAHRKRQLEERMAAGSRWHEMGLVFSTGIGTPLDPADLNHHFRRTLERARLPQKRFHDLRHGAASALLAAEVHPRVVMEILGHSNISLTMNTYTHVVEQLKREAAAKMDALLAERA
jgi:integrase